MKNDAVYWIWLSRGLGVASTVARIVLEKGLDAKALYQMDLTALIQLELFAPRLCKKLKALPLTAAYNVLEDCAQKGYSVITPEDDNYPRQFYALQGPAVVVYAQGNVACWDRCTICRCWRWWEPATPPNMGAGWRRICPTIWHRQDLSSSADWRWASIPTPIPARCVPGSGRFAVLGSGLDTDYPPQSAPMRKQILATGGVVLTELEPSVPVRGSVLLRISINACWQD